MAKYMNEQLLLRLPHRQFVFALLRDFTSEAAGKPPRTAGVVVCQSAGACCRFHPHWRGLLLERGLVAEGRFVHIPRIDLE
jgi:hypothetical protein